MTQLALGWVLAFTDAASEPDSSSPLTLLIPFIVLGGVFYFFMIMPQRRRARAMQELRDAVQVGDEIRTIGGIRGVVRNLDDDELTLDVGGGTSFTLTRRAVAEVLKGDEE